MIFQAKQRSDEARWVFLVLKLTSLFVTQPTVLDLASRKCKEFITLRVENIISSVENEISQERPLMHLRKRVVQIGASQSSTVDETLF